ncbi:hypothetical protein CDL12_17370 [Handroanthus impetiginosus]|uniref:Uncharacterized protein n=1 Tax=Handroanthus impetiginosus TaxID=429701 RepID=A0A2G9GXW4_9LAMI|nr:hypothetical protein CDL12_17370 [Handroanthus impetiginosus]
MTLFLISIHMEISKALFCMSRCTGFGNWDRRGCAKMPLLYCQWIKSDFARERFSSLACIFYYISINMLLVCKARMVVVGGKFVLYISSLIRHGTGINAATASIHIS